MAKKQKKSVKSHKAKKAVKAKKTAPKKAPKKALKKAKPMAKKAVAKPIAAPMKKAGRPAKGKNIKQPLSPSPLIKTKVIAPKVSALIITKSQATPPVTKEKALTTSEINKYRDILQQKREDLAQLVARKKETEFQEVEPEIGDEADIATASVEKDILYEMTDVEQQALDSVEAALRKIEKGVYGRCEICGQQIPRQRLDVMPWARNCVFCQSKNEAPTPAAPVAPAQAE